MEIMAILRAETAASHSRLESLPYFAELIAHRLPLECYVNQLRNTGYLLVSAVIDEKNGIPGSLRGLQQWLVDADRFSSGWIAAVEQTIHKVREKGTATNSIKKSI